MLEESREAKLAAALAYLDKQGINRTRPDCGHEYEAADTMATLEKHISVNINKFHLIVEDEEAR